MGPCPPPKGGIIPCGGAITEPTWSGPDPGICPATELIGAPEDGGLDMLTEGSLGGATGIWKPVDIGGGMPGAMKGGRIPGGKFG